MAQLHLRGTDRLRPERRDKLRAKLFELQNGICAICGGLMNYDSNSQDYVSMDRILTGNEGYGYFYLNLRGVHKKCNIARGCDPEDVQIGKLIITLQLVASYRNFRQETSPVTIASWIIKKVINSPYRYGLGWEIANFNIQDAKFHQLHPNKVGAAVKLQIGYRYNITRQHEAIDNVIDSVESHLGKYLNENSRIEIVRIIEESIE